MDNTIIHMMHRAYLERLGNTVTDLFYDFSSEFNTFQPLLFVKKLSAMLVDHDMVA